MSSFDTFISFLTKRKKDRLSNVLIKKDVSLIKDTYCTSRNLCTICRALNEYFDKSSIFEGYVPDCGLLQDQRFFYKKESQKNPITISSSIQSEIELSQDLFDILVDDYLFEKNLSTWNYNYICRDTFYSFSQSYLTFDSLQNVPSLIREDHHDAVALKDTRKPLKATTCQNILFFLLQTYENFNKLKFLPQGLTHSSLRFVMQKNSFEVLKLITESRFTVFLKNVPSISFMSEGHKVKVRDISLLKPTGDDVLVGKDGYLINDPISMLNLCKLQLIDDIDVLGFSFLILLLSLMSEYPFSCTVHVDETLKKIWSFIWSPEDLLIVNERLADIEDTLDISQVMFLMSELTLKRNLLPKLSEYIQTLF